MLVRVWRYQVAPGREAEFERVYGSDGDWARVFARSEGFLGTRLYRDVEAPDTYLTVDQLDDAEAWSRFLEAHRDAYEAPDRRCGSLTVAEMEVSSGGHSGHGPS